RAAGVLGGQRRGAGASAQGAPGPGETGNEVQRARPRRAGHEDPPPRTRHGAGRAEDLRRGLLRGESGVTHEREGGRRKAGGEPTCDNGVSLPPTALPPTAYRLPRYPGFLAVADDVASRSAYWER